MRVLWILSLIVALAVFANAQACGPASLSIYLTNNEGELIKNATVQFLYEEYENKDQIEIPWLEKIQGFSRTVGRWSGVKIRLKITASGYHNFEKIFDIPRGWTSYSIKLSRKGQKESAQISNLTHFEGKVIDEKEAIIPSAILEITGENGKKYYTKSDSDGWFEIDLPLGKYTVKVSQQGFKDLKLINFNPENKSWIRLNLKLKVRGCDDCKTSILGKDWEPKIQEVILDYQKIKEKQ